MTSPHRPEAVEGKAGVASSVDNVTVGAVSHRRRELDAVPALVDDALTWALTLEADSLTSRPALEAALAMAGARAWVICRVLGGGVMTTGDNT